MLIVLHPLLCFVVILCLFVFLVAESLSAISGCWPLPQGRWDRL